MPSSEKNKDMAQHFQKGDRVEVMGAPHNHAFTTWYPAKVLRAAHRAHIYVEFDTHKAAAGDEEEAKPPLREFVEVADVRPAPPQELHRFFRVGEVVEAFSGEKKGWRKAEVVDILENSKYALSFCGAGGNGVSETGVVVEEVEQWRMRVCRIWDDGSWVPPLQLQKNSTEVESKAKDLKLRIKCSGNTLEQFSKGTVVEVKSDEEGYQGSWYTALILGPVGNNKFMVEYQTLKTDDESAPLKETACASFIRPLPPKIERTCPFKMLEEVDAWYNDGWWVGFISKILRGLKYAVYFWTTDEELEFYHKDLRPHQEWIGGKWIIAFKKKSKLLVKSKLGKLKGGNGGASGAFFGLGEKVEVKSDEEGFKGSWYPAIIRGPEQDGKYLVLYQTLKTEDETAFLEEEADTVCIRPCPPVVQQTDRFKPLEEVDAWHNEGWWIGQVCSVLDGSKYRVYFRSSNEVLEFRHSNLRPHKDWINGQWIPTIRGRLR